MTWDNDGCMLLETDAAADGISGGNWLLDILAT
jgi:hypothetical protein